MTNVDLDPDALDEFAAQLSAFSRELRSQQGRLRAQFRRLGETWRDPQYARFAQQFEPTMRTLEKFAEAGDEIAPKLKAKAQRARQVHG